MDDSEARNSFGAGVGGGFPGLAGKKSVGKRLRTFFSRLSFGEWFFFCSKDSERIERSDQRRYTKLAADPSFRGEGGERREDRLIHNRKAPSSLETLITTLRTTLNSA